MSLKKLKEDLMGGVPFRLDVREEESRMTPRYSTCATRKMVLQFPEMGKIGGEVTLGVLCCYC